MPSKQAILDNIEEYSATELVVYIKDGTVTFAELCDETDGCFPAHVRKEVKRMLSGSEEEDWGKARTANRVDAYMQFLNTYPDSEHADEARDAITDLQQAAADDAKEGFWESVDKTDMAALRRFIAENPQDSHCTEAQKIINRLQEEEFLGFDINALIDKILAIQTDKEVNDPDAQIVNEIISALNKKRITQQELLDVIRRDNNLLRASVLKNLIYEGHLSYQDLVDIGIDRLFIEHLAKGETKQPFGLPKKLDRINKVCTEVYFWGIPSSGKSCAIGAILSVANNGKVARSMSKDPDCQGYGYMTRLAQLFKADGKVGTLPEGTSIYSTYEMGFDLEDEHGATHPITCVDLAGELVRCMYKSDAGEEMTDDELMALDTLTNVLVDNRTVNRKMHFFVLEFGGEDRKYEGLSQTAYLDAALRYIDRTKIFHSETDAIYLMLTKVDKTGKLGRELVEELSDYIENKYKGFYQGLTKICHDHEINGGVVDRIPFSLGKVCFQDYCLFNEAPAANVVKKLLTRSKGFKNGKLQKGLNIFKK